MGKYNLGEISTTISNQISKDRIYINEKKANPLVHDAESQLDVLKKSFNRIQNLINQAVNSGIVTGKRADAFKKWAKKSKSQASNCEKLKENFVSKYTEDVKSYPIKLLDERISELEKKIDAMTSEI